MSIRNNHWYNLNEQRSYPLDDTASALSDADDRLPAALIADLRLRWPITYGRYAFISSASVTSHIVTVIIETTDDLDNSPSSSVLIAGVSLPLATLTQGRTYALETFKDGVGGFITFGSGSSDLPFKGVFSTPRQSLLTPRAARSSRIPPIPTIGIENAETQLNGVINLVAPAPLQLSKETRIIQNAEYDNVIVVRLTEETREIEDAQFSESVFSRFAGPCGRRVGSKSCVDPQPIETINGITPDCDGVITLEFEGCATIGRNVDDCGVVIDCDLGLTDSCDPPYLPTLDTGQLPSEVTPVIIPPPVPEEPPTGGENSISDVIETLLTFPYCDTFDDSVAYSFAPTGNSLFGFIGEESPDESACCVGEPNGTFYGCTNSQSISDGLWEIVPPVAVSYGAVVDAAQSRTNISLFTVDVQTLYRLYTTDVKVTNGMPGSSLNGGMLINYKVLPSSLPTYFIALLDIDSATFGLYYFNGVQLVSLAEVEILDLRSEEWFRITIQATPNQLNLTSVDFVVTLKGIDDPTIDVTINVNVSGNLWGVDSGLAGLYSNRSRSFFSFWRIDEV